MQSAPAASAYPPPPGALIKRDVCMSVNMPLKGDKMEQWDHRVLLQKLTPEFTNGAFSLAGTLRTHRGRAGFKPYGDSHGSYVSIMSS